MKAYHNESPNIFPPSGENDKLDRMRVHFSEFFVFALAFVFPGEMVSFPDIDEAVFAFGAFGGGGGGVDGFFEGVVLAGAIRLGGGGLVEKMAEVEEVFVGGGAFGEGCASPF